MSQQVSPISAAAHYLASAIFWENHAKVLQHQLDQALARIAELEDDAAKPPPNNATTHQTHS